MSYNLVLFSQPMFYGASCIFYSIWYKPSFSPSQPHFHSHYIYICCELQERSVHLTSFSTYTFYCSDLACLTEWWNETYFMCQLHYIAVRCVCMEAVRVVWSVCECVSWGLSPLSGWQKHSKPFPEAQEGVGSKQSALSLTRSPLV